MTATGAKPVYHRLTVVATRGTVIWLLDDLWHPVQRAVGTLDTRLLPGRYFIELGEARPRDVAYPIELFNDLSLDQSVLRSAPTCLPQAPKLMDQ